MRAIVILIIVAILGYFGYEYASNGRTPADVMSGRDPVAEAAAAAETAADEAAAAAEAAAAEAAAATEAAAAEATAAVEAAAAEAAAVVEAAAAEAAATEQAAAAAAEAAATEQAAGDAAAAEAAAAEQAAADAAAAEAAAAETAAAPAMSIDELLDPANFDLAKVTAAIEASSMDAALKTQLTTAVTRAANSPGLLPLVLERIKSAIAG